MVIFNKKIEWMDSFMTRMAIKIYFTKINIHKFFLSVSTKITEGFGYKTRKRYSNIKVLTQ